MALGVQRSPAPTLVCTLPAPLPPLRFSRQYWHCVAGRPFFLTSKRGRSVCVHPETRCPLMQVAHAYFLSLMSTMIGNGESRRERLKACKQGRGCLGLLGLRVGRLQDLQEHLQLGHLAGAEEGRYTGAVVAASCTRCKVLTIWVGQIVQDRGRL